MTALYNGSSLIISRVFQNITINSIYFSLKHFVVPISHSIFGYSTVCFWHYAFSSREQQEVDWYEKCRTGTYHCRAGSSISRGRLGGSRNSKHQQLVYTYFLSISAKKALNRSKNSVSLNVISSPTLYFNTKHTLFLPLNPCLLSGKYAISMKRHLEQYGMFCCSLPRDQLLYDSLLRIQAETSAGSRATPPVLVTSSRKRAARVSILMSSEVAMPNF